MDPLLIPTFFCPKAWESMAGDETRRFCSYCNKHVHNLNALSVSERLALLSSPAAQICARYKIALRRPKPGRRESYARHLAKYGLGVAATGSVLLVVWEAYARATRMPHPPAHYLAVSPTETGTCEAWIPMPDDFYVEVEMTVAGGITAMFPQPSSTTTSCPPGQKPSDSVEVRLDPVQLQSLLKSMPAPEPHFVTPPFKAKKKAGIFAGLRKHH